MEAIAANTTKQPSPQKKPKKPPKPHFSDGDRETARWIYEKLLELNPGHKKPNLGSWANVVRLMRERDGRTLEQIRDLFEWANSDDFWKSNILSPAKLREQWDPLTIKKKERTMRTATKPAAAPANATTPIGKSQPVTTNSNSPNDEPEKPDFMAVLAKKCPTLFGATRLTDAELAARAEEGERRRQEETDAKRKAAILERWNRLARQLGDDYRDCRLSTFRLYKAPDIAIQQKAALDALVAYAKDMPSNVKSGRGIVLRGPSGTGKDHCLAALARVAVLQYGLTVCWVRGSKFCIESRAVMGESEEAFIERFTRMQILYLSDPLPPVGGLTPHQSAMLYEIIDERNRKHRPTWVTLNVADRTDADTRLGAANVDRLIERALTVEFDWPSFRTGGVGLLK